MAELNLKIRHEGEQINCYMPLKVDGSETLCIASMRTTVADLHPELFDAFVAFCTTLMRTMLESRGMSIDRIVQRDAPEHEKAGHA